MKAFVALGDRIAERWERAHYGEAAFDTIAANELRASGVLHSASLDEIATWFMTSRQLPPQELGPFGHPPIRVYQGRTFQIDLLIWVDTPTAIHQHAFAGAWGVLLGSSFHAEYRFDPAEGLGEDVALGVLSLASFEWLQRGDVRPIRPGDGFIHSLIHLEAPTVSVVIRTNAERRFAPQLQYLPPGLAINPFYRPEPMQTQLELMKTLLRTEPRTFRRFALEAVAARDAYFVYALLAAVSAAGDLAMLVDLLAAARARHGALADALDAALGEERRGSALRRRLRDVVDPEQRYLLATLLTAPHRASMVRMVHTRFPDGDPEAKLVELIARTGAGTDLALDRLSLRLLQFAMRGSTFDEVARAFRDRFDERTDWDALSRRWAEIHAIDVLRPILTGQPKGVSHAN